MNVYAYCTPIPVACASMADCDCLLTVTQLDPAKATCEGDAKNGYGIDDCTDPSSNCPLLTGSASSTGP